MDLVEQKPPAVLIGFLYGLSLTVVGIGLAGAGHGTYLLLGVASAPLSLFGIIASVVSPPLLWTALWILLAYGSKEHRRKIVAIALIVHYMGIFLVSLYGNEYAEGKYIARVWDANPFMIVIGIALYLSGQLAIWLYWLKIGRQSDSLIGD